MSLNVALAALTAISAPAAVSGDRVRVQFGPRDPSQPTQEERRKARKLERQRKRAGRK